MPVFLFISGYFSKNNPKRILKYLYYYVLFQIIYLIFDGLFIEGLPLKDIVISFTTPHWILWYLVVLIYFCLICNLLDNVSNNKKFFIILLSFLISLLSGFDKDIGYFLSLGRFCGYLPFMVLGYYYKDLPFEKVNKFKKSMGLIILSIFGICLSIIYLTITQGLDARIFYFVHPYVENAYTMWTKLILLLIGFNWILFFILILGPIFNKKIKILSTIGKNSLIVFIFHGFITETIGKLEILDIFYGYRIFVIFILSILILLFLGNNFVSKILKRLFKL